MPVIEILYAEALADIEICGDWNDVKKGFEQPREDKLNLKRNIYEKYEHILDGWDNYNLESVVDDDDFSNDLEEVEDEDDNHFYKLEEEVKAIPAILPKPKVGRNALCPCGIGKKFKRCCVKD